MSYLVLARKYRPQSFDDLVGQSHIAQTLTHAIESDRLAHAFLFTGVRGVGKTTSARLLAKCINCVGEDGTRDRPTPTPCQKCSPCREITSGDDLDVQEIDGASYNGIDEVRRLQEGIPFLPARDRFKIYIVDEVHMLTQAAWNAFLKTLEEPPPHVKFIFATTEVHKVPVTILSRCQRYDFKLIPARTISERLKQVLNWEAIQADDSAIALLAQEASGSMRDAMSLVDQVIAYSGERITQEDVTHVLGVANREAIHRLTEAVLTGQCESVLLSVESLAEQGLDLVHASRELLFYFRHLIVSKTCATSASDLLDLADHEIQQIRTLAASHAHDDLIRVFNGFSQAFDGIAKNQEPRIALEMALVRLARRPPFVPIDEWLTRLERLEQKLGSVPPKGGGSDGSPLSNRRTDTESLPTQIAPQRVESSLASIASVPTAKSGIDGWREIVESMRTTHPAIAAIYAHATPLEVGHETIRLQYESDSILASQAMAHDAVHCLEQKAELYFSTKTRIAFEERSPSCASPSLAAIEQQDQKAKRDALWTSVENNPVVKQLIEWTGAELREVRPRPPI